MNDRSFILPKNYYRIAIDKTPAITEAALEVNALYDDYLDKTKFAGHERTLSGISPEAEKLRTALERAMATLKGVVRSEYPDFDPSNMGSDMQRIDMERAENNAINEFLARINPNAGKRRIFLPDLPQDRARG